MYPCMCTCMLVSSFFFLFNFQTLKFFVTLFSGTVRPRRLKLGTHVDNGQMYHVYHNQAATAYLSHYFFISSPVRSTRRAIAVTPVVRVPATLRPSFISKFSKSSYLDSHSSESIYIWTIGTLEGRLSFHDS